MQGRSRGQGGNKQHAASCSSACSSSSALAILRSPSRKSWGTISGEVACATRQIGRCAWRSRPTHAFIVTTVGRTKDWPSGDLRVA
eukprot:6197672-Pleurochrysis_carterae.AAC.2